MAKNARMRALLPSLLFVATSHAIAVPSDAEAQAAHASGRCGTLGPGTGLGADGTGWIVSMLPGEHEFRVRGKGTVGVTVALRTKQEFDVGRLYYIVFKPASPDAVLEWKTPFGGGWGPVSKLFLYPPQGNPYK
jgi:hypothetical protein